MKIFFQSLWVKLNQIFMQKSCNIERLKHNRFKYQIVEQIEWQG